jgi:CubicO group peptidase (beta-lactamase class C family)
MKKKSILFITLVFCLLAFEHQAGVEDRFHQGNKKNKTGTSRKNKFRTQAYDPNPYNWRVSTPEDQGLKADLFEAAYKEAEKTPFMYSVLAVWNGYLIAEKYFNGQNKYIANHIHSASKSFMSALIGIAFDEGYFTSLNQKMMDFFPEYHSANLDPRKYDITLEHLLMMRAGFDWDDSERQWQEYATSPNWVDYVLNLPLRFNPGEVFHYSTVQTNLLSVIISRVTGLSTKEFADFYLFDTLGISIRQWHRDPQGYYTGGHEMYYSPRDMARFGYLYLNHGLIDDQQIIPSGWINESWNRSGTSTWPWSPLEDTGYGYQWWLGKLSHYDVFFASGKGGQHIICVPDLNMVVVTTTDADAWKRSWEKNLFTLRIVAHFFLSPIRGLRGPAPFPPRELSIQKVSNRGLATREDIHILRWEPNPVNTGINIEKYRIYHFLEARKLFLAEVDSGIFEYWHRKADKAGSTTYAITAITDNNEESGVILSSVAQK